jgi:methylglyoxal synthase
MNEHSVIEWASRGLDQRATLNRQPCPPKFQIGGVKPEDDEEVTITKRQDSSFAIQWESLVRKRKESGKKTLALIAHDDMKSRIEDFVLDYRPQLNKFDRIVATGTTGKVVQEAAPVLAVKVRRYNSGPKGGDIEIATEMIFKSCDVAIFLIDPLSAHPHTEDIKTLLGAGILNNVRLLTNERQAREWMDRGGGDVDQCEEYDNWKDRRNPPLAQGAPTRPLDT